MESAERSFRVFLALSVYARCVPRAPEISYWRLSSGIKVDFILGDGETAIEVKGKNHVHGRDTRHLLEFRREHAEVRQLIVVCMEPKARITDEGVRILPWRDFLEALWNGDFE